ncbi:MAG: hypothetical protein ACK5MP_00705 [Nostocoides sp.]
MPTTAAGHRGSTLTFALLVFAAFGVAGAAAAGTILAVVGLWAWWIGLIGAVVGCAIGFRLVDGWGKPTADVTVWGTLLLACGIGTWAYLTHNELLVGASSAARTVRAAFGLNHWRGVSFATDDATIFAGDSARDALRQVTTSVVTPASEAPVLTGGAVPFALGDALVGPQGPWLAVAVCGALAVMAYAVLAQSALNGWWPVLAAAVAGVTLPLLNTARATHTDLVALPLQLAALALAGIALSTGRRRWRRRDRAAIGAGLLLGAAVLIRLDSLILVCAALIALLVSGWRRRRHGRLFATTATLTALAATGLQAASWRSAEALVHNQVLPSLIAMSVLLLLTFAAPATPPSWSGTTALAVVGAIAVILLAAASLVTGTGRQVLTAVGVPVFAAGAVTAAVGVGGDVKAGWAKAHPHVGLPLLTGLTASAAVVFLPESLWPATAGGRPLLIPVTLVAMSAVAGGYWLTRRAPIQWRNPATAAVVVVALGSPLIASGPHALDRINDGQISAVDLLCRSLHRQADAVIVDDRSSAQWAEVIQARCGLPVRQVAPDGLASGGTRTASTAASTASPGTSGANITLVATTADQARADADALSAIGTPDLVLGQQVSLHDSLTGRPSAPTPVQLWSVIVVPTG